ncbi:hypothetical protein [Nocardia sp. CA-145437]|uniref:hypothetical protein n=1 Tax=Nocardia sp. CA-145437 TaxID=3239980 RepID=UPI003D98E0DA
MTFPSGIAAAPNRLPLLGHMVSLLRDPLGFLSSLPAHGDLVRIGLGPVDAVAVCDPGLTQELLRRDRVFDKGGPCWIGSARCSATGWSPARTPRTADIGDWCSPLFIRAGPPTTRR